MQGAHCPQPLRVLSHTFGHPAHQLHRDVNEVVALVSDGDVIQRAQAQHGAHRRQLVVQGLGARRPAPCAARLTPANPRPGRNRPSRSSAAAAASSTGPAASRAAACTGPPARASREASSGQRVWGARRAGSPRAASAARPARPRTPRGWWCRAAHGPFSRSGSERIGVSKQCRQRRVRAV